MKYDVGEALRMMDEQVLPFYEKDYTCPFCSHAFKSRKIRTSYAKPVKMDTDFAPIYETSDNPLFYKINVCPKCGYSYTDQFENRLTIKDEQRIREVITAGWIPTDYGKNRTIEQAIATYKLALLTATLKKEKSIVIAGICLRLAWLFRFQENKKEETRFLSNALKEYIKAKDLMEHYYFSSMSEVRIVYLIGELHRRLGKEEQAKIFFEKALKYRHSTSEREVIKLAEDQLHLLQQTTKIAL